MTKALVLLTAMPPTVGHGHLIRWATNFLKASETINPQLFVLVCTQPGEPLCSERFEAVDRFCDSIRTVPVSAIFLHAKMPQYPKNAHDLDFWRVWQREIRRHVGTVDIVFSSESYGRRLAMELDAKPVIVDPERVTHAVSASAVRADPVGRFGDILPEFRRHVVKTVTVFGAESTGKTTLSKGMGGDHVTEWARPYLESLASPETTDERMADIVSGQYASQVTASNAARSPIIVQDTDLLSTIGYYRIYTDRWAENADYWRCMAAFNRTRSDLYIVLKSDIPYTPDPLRYGGDHRESTDRFWIDLLDEFKCNCQIIYTVVPGQRVQVADKLALSLFLDQPIWSFVRDKAEAA